MIEHSMSRSAQTMQLVKLLRQLEVEKVFFTGSDFLTKLLPSSYACCEKLARGKKLLHVKQPLHPLDLKSVV